MPKDFTHFVLRVIIFDVTFYIVVIIIGINVVTAIVTSTFVELRDEVRTYIMSLLCNYMHVVCFQMYSGGK